MNEGDGIRIVGMAHHSLEWVAVSGRRIPPRKAMALHTDHKTHEELEL